MNRISQTLMVRKFSIVYGLFCLWWIMPFILDFDFFFSSEAPLAANNYFTSIFSVTIKNSLDATIIVFVFLVSSIGLIFCRQQPLSSFLIFLIINSVNQRVWLAGRGVDDIMKMLAIFFFIYSDDHFSKKIFPSFVLRYLTPERYLSLFFFIIYTSNSIAKMMGSDWVNGVAVYYAISLPKLNLFHVPDFFRMPTVVQFLTYYTVAIEMLLGIVIFLRKFSYFFLVIAISFHFALGFFMALNPWHEIFITCLIFVFLFQKSSGSGDSKVLSEV